MSEERIEPAPLNTALLYKMLKEIRELVQLHKETTPEGVEFRIPTVTVTGVHTINFIKDYPFRPVRGVDFFNKGPDTCYIRINEEKEVDLEDRESLSVYRPKATIHHIILRVDKGKSAVVRMVGRY